MDSPSRLTIAILIALTVSGCTRSQADIFRAAPMAARLVVPPAPPEAPSCSWLGVVIDNAPPARPQWGLSQADIVYEVPTEGMITRFLALFCNGGPDTLGPVRSLRLQFLAIAHDYGATVAHSGSSESALDAVTRGGGPIINEFWKSQPFRRDHTRPMPHNLFTSVTKLREYVTDAPPSADRLWDTADVAPAPDAMTITVPYGWGFTVRFEYDPATGRYRRLIQDQNAIDPLTGDPLEVAAVVVQYVKWWQVYEGPVLTSRTELTGHGKLTVFAAGRQFDGTWQRPDGATRTSWADVAGQRMRLPPGRVWICLLPSERVALATPPPASSVR
jgi:Protein of unknown function (DUF3048) N-terminal domain/Protein of unknown function (DUF3048) C-terminal domain